MRVRLPSSVPNLEESEMNIRDDSKIYARLVKNGKLHIVNFTMTADYGKEYDWTIYTKCGKDARKPDHKTSYQGQLGYIALRNPESICKRCLRRVVPHI